MDVTARASAIVAGLVLAGLIIGMMIGGIGGGDDAPDVVVQTVEVTVPTTVTRTRTVTRVRTVEVDDPFADETDTTDTTDTDTDTTETTPSGADCSDEYLGACVPVDADRSDVSCSQLPDTNFDSIGNDPYNLDPDEDGIACET